MDRIDATPFDEAKAQAILPSPAIDEDTVVLVAGANDNFAIGLTVALCSALRRLDPRRPAHVFVLDGGFTPRSRDRCERCLRNARPDAAITFFDNDPARFAGLKDHGYTAAAYLRLLIPEVVPASYRWAIYLDSDVVVDGDLAELWTLRDENKAFWAALDAGAIGTSFVADALGFWNVSADTPYFNSGVMFIDLPRWRAARISERALQVLNDHSDKCLNADQDALNVVALDNWSVLPAAWNCQFSGMQTCSFDKGVPDGLPGITHFLGEKPWTPGTMCYRHDRFNAALRESGWYSRSEFLKFAARRSVRSTRFRIGSWARRRPAFARVLKAVRG